MYADVKWAKSRSGNLQIALGTVANPVPPQKQYEVWAIITGTHDLASGATGSFSDLEDARQFANNLWSQR